MAAKLPKIPTLLAIIALLLSAISSGCDCTDDVGGTPTGDECIHSDDCPADGECVDGYCIGGDNDVSPDAGPTSDADAQGTPDVGEDADAGGEDVDPDPDCPIEVTCEEEGVQCGNIADGCGQTINCGTCPDGHVCGTGDDHGQCISVQSVCTPTGDCAEEGVECGSIPDGCGGTIDCGSCGPGEVCGAGLNAGLCVYEDCTPISCSDYPAECGPIPDGCGGFVDCGACDNGEICGSGTDRGMCLEASCTPLTCNDYFPGECGPHPDGCGGTIDCGICTDGQICGTGSELGQCVESTCEPLTCADYPDINCGVMSDGCGGVTQSCGSCVSPEICGGGGEPNVCGADSQAECDYLCPYQAVCSSGEATTLTGTVYAPNATLPIPNAVVYVPNVPLDDLPPIETGPICQQCEDEDLGSPLVGTVTDYDGSFELRHVPADVEFPLVIKIGQWRRVVMIPPQTACGQTELTAQQTRLPRTQAEGNEHDNLPFTAISTGGVDAMECVFYKLGVDESEFTRWYQDGRFHMYRANGGVPDQQLDDACQDPNVWCDYDVCTDRDPGSCGTSSSGLLLQQNLSNLLYQDQDMLNNYDMVVMGCEANDHSAWRSSGDLQRMLNYVNAGGRLFASHYAYDWLHQTSELQNTAIWGGGEDFESESLAFVDDTGPAGTTFWDWLQLVGADYPTPGPNGEPQIEIADPRTYVQDVNASLARRWVHTDASAPGHVNRDSIQQYSFDTPVYADDDEQCGRVAYSAFHVAGVNTLWGFSFPGYCSTGDLTAQEKVLAYMLFDLASCVSPGGEPVEPECTPLTCDDVDVECGVVSDGCGGVTDNCGDCPDGTACGAGGEPNVCGGDCQPLSCEDHDAECGVVDDGCGGTLDCGDCPQGTECGGGGVPNQCGCTPMTCGDHGAECGTVSDGCGGTLDCGDCPEGTSCGAGGTPNICSGDCVPLSCEDHGAECGAVADGCGGTLDCGDCPDPMTCGGAGEANICGCTALTCEDHGAECGEVSDGCGDIIDCGFCKEPMICDQFMCVDPPCRPDGEECSMNVECCSQTCATISGSDEGVCVSG